MYKEHDVYFNTKIKKYPGGGYQITYCDDQIYKDAEIEPLHEIDMPRPKKLSDEEKEAKRIDRRQNEDEDLQQSKSAMLRAKRRVFDLVYLNQFKYFVTLTFDLGKMNSYDPVAVRKAVQDFTKHRVERNGLQYILIPEYHKIKAGEKSPKIHLHGFFNEPKGGLHFEPSLTKSGTQRKSKSGRLVWNIPEWANEYGWTTACQIDGDVANCAKYITKYVTKNIGLIFGNYYLAGGIERKVPTELANTEFSKVEGKCYTFEMQYYSRSFKYESSWDREVDEDGKKLPFCSYLDDFEFAEKGVKHGSYCYKSN